MDEMWLIIMMFFMVLIFVFMVAVTQGWIDIAKPQIAIGAAILVKNKRTRKR
ncbi:hypothetical protein HYZ41_01135 [archaeon]|nr:hypothetical protein [archaeon]